MAERERPMNWGTGSGCIDGRASPASNGPWNGWCTGAGAWRSSKYWNLLAELRCLSGSVHYPTLLANSEAALWTATLGGKARLKPRYLTEFRISSGLIVYFANSVIIRAPISGSNIR
jgi:hypothetical protein